MQSAAGAEAGSPPTRVGVILLEVREEDLGENRPLTEPEEREELADAGLDAATIDRQIAEMGFPRAHVEVELFAEFADGRRIETSAKHGRERFHVARGDTSSEAAILESVTWARRMASSAERWERLVAALGTHGIRVTPRELDALPVEVEVRKRG